MTNNFTIVHQPLGFNKIKAKVTPPGENTEYEVFFDSLNASLFNHFRKDNKKAFRQVLLGTTTSFDMFTANAYFLEIKANGVKPEDIKQEVIDYAMHKCVGELKLTPLGRPLFNSGRPEGLTIHWDREKPRPFGKWRFIKIDKGVLDVTSESFIPEQECIIHRDLTDVLTMYVQDLIKYTSLPEPVKKYIYNQVVTKFTLEVRSS